MSTPKPLAVEPAAPAHRRATEARLLVWAMGCGLVALLLVRLAAGELLWLREGAVAGALVVGPLAAHLALRRRAPAADPLLLPVAVALAGLGLAAVDRLRPELAVRQAAWLLVGLSACVALAGAPLQRWERFRYVWGGVGLLLLALTLVFGVTVGGARSWLALGPIRFQPAEVVKLLLVLFLAGYLSERAELLAKSTRRLGPLELPRARHIGPLLVVWGWFLVLFVIQRDLGAALILFGVTVAMLVAASERWFYLVAGLLLAVAGASAAHALFGHVRVRFAVWMDPWTHVNGGGYQIAQSLFAVAAGGIWGSGWGLGEPDVIPAVHTDFVFAALAEETGLAGALAVLALLFVLVSRGVRVALRVGDTALSLVAFGLAMQLALQTVLIVGGVTRLLPLTGVTLPFVSYGGSSMLSSFAALGMWLRISHLQAEERHAASWVRPEAVPASLPSREVQA